MRDRGVGALVVLDEAGRPVGLLTDRDITVRVVASGSDPQTARVGEAMTEHPKTVHESTPIESALALMRSGAFRRLPVVDDRGAAVGIVSIDDVLGLLAEELGLLGELFARQAPRPAHAIRS
jgi:CBS domain-containing protein